MGAEGKKALSARDQAIQKRLRLAGVAVLFVGLSAAALINGAAAPVDESILADTKRSEYQMELIGGKSNEFAYEIREWFSGLWHGTGLAHMLAFLSIATFLTCFFLAHRLNFAPRPANRPAGKDA